MSWPQDAFLYLRQIVTPKGRPQAGGNLLYTKSDNNLYLLDADGTEHAVSGGGGGGVASITPGTNITVDNTIPTAPVVAAPNAATLTGTEVLTNKDLSDASNVFPSALATDAEVTSAVSTHAALTATHGATGAVVGTTNTQTLTNKTLTSPKVSTNVLDASGNILIGTHASASAVNNLAVYNAIAGASPILAAEGTDTDISVKLLPKGAGTVQAAGVPVVTTTGTQTLTNKTLTSPTITGQTLDGVALKARTSGAVTATTDASGDLTITHGLGTTPTAVLVTSGYLTAAVVVTAHTIGATTFKVRNKTSSTGAALASTASVIVYWEAIV